MQLDTLRHEVGQVADAAVEFFRELIRIPSFSGAEEKIVLRLEREMQALGYDEVRIDGFGNVLGRVGRGPHVLAFDGHVDTVGVGDPSQWQVDPFGAELVDGVVYGRGAADQKGGVAASVYAGHLIKKLGLAEDLTVWIVGSVLEEDCEGLCWRHILEDMPRPAAVVITEPTCLQVYRGQRGRLEIEVTTRGLSAHGSAPERGVNAIYEMVPIIQGVSILNERLTGEPFLGKGTITISQIRSTSPSLCAVADSATIHLDRRLAAHEDEELAVAQIRELAGSGVELRVLDFERASWTGRAARMKMHYPTWQLAEDHPFTQLALDAQADVTGERHEPGRWQFSTNGVATAGMYGIPTIGFGPADERHAHAPTDRCPAWHIPTAMMLYTRLVERARGVFPSSG